MDSADFCLGYSPNQSLLIDRMDVQLKEQIGQGGFANIYRGNRVSGFLRLTLVGYWHGTEVAVKVIKGTANTGNFIQEAKLMRYRTHFSFFGLTNV
jgi:predicted Ser/Thr protein kinase